MPHTNTNNSINVVISISSYLSLLIKSISLYHNKNFYFFHLSSFSMIYNTKKAVDHFDRLLDLLY